MNLFQIEAPSARTRAFFLGVLFMLVIAALLGFRMEMEWCGGISKKLIRGGDNRTSVLNATSMTTTKSTFGFEAENLLVAERVPCGANKCFFASKSDPTVGYLVAPSKRRTRNQPEKEWFKTLEASWELANRLEKEYGIKHFSLEAPRNITITHSLAARLNQNLWSEKRAEFINEERFFEQSTAFVQQVKTAPVPNLLFGCVDNKVVQFQREVKKFIPLIKRKRRFARRFQRYLNQAREMMQKEPCMIKDFQGLISTKGRIYHLDYDRCFDPHDSSKKRVVTKKKANSCFKALDEIEASLLQSLKPRRGN